jgi:hypothetical protein
VWHDWAAIGAESGAGLTRQEETPMKFGLLVVMAALGGAGAVYAQQEQHGPGPETPEQLAVRAEVDQACAMDMKTICGGQTGRAARTCLDHNPAKVSRPCQTALDKLPKAPAPPADRRK